MTAIHLENELKQYFGFNEFRPHQREIVDLSLNQRDLVAILPTGSGKSLCYQLPALLKPGTTIVISPLISLMQDQVLQLTKQGISAAYLNSTLSRYEQDMILNNFNHYKLIYISPERLAMEPFQNILRHQQISGFVIDEAHCISQWGHSFRLEYRNLSCLKELFPTVPISAFTATATRDVTVDIMTQLNLTNATLIQSSFDRPNLFIRVQEKESYEKQVLEYLKDKTDTSGIIYASTRRRVDKLYETLLQKGYKVGKYHAGLSEQQRHTTLAEFIHENINIVVATIAFGMGINKPNVRFVYHVDMPQNMEQYYQEIGRAGRDGLPADCIMLYSLKDIILQKKLLEDIPNETIKHHLRRKSEQLLAMCNSAQCRRKEILHYFGETATTHNCNNCDNCIDDIDMIDGTIIAQKILSCVYRLQSRFGVNYVIDVLKGSTNQQLLQRQHDTLSTYGIMKDDLKTDIRQYIFSLLNMGYLDISDGDYPILRLTTASKEILFERKQLQFRKKRVKAKTEKKTTKPSSIQLQQLDQPLYLELKKVRKQLADKLKVPPYIIFHDKTLMDMATSKPKNEHAFLFVNGVGEQKLQKYGKPFLKAIQNFMV